MGMVQALGLSKISFSCCILVGLQEWGVSQHGVSMGRCVLVGVHVLCFNDPSTHSCWVPKAMENPFAVINRMSLDLLSLTSLLFSTLLGSSQLFTLALLTSSQLFNSSLLFSALLTSPVLMPSWGFSGSNIKDLIFLPTCNLAMWNSTVKSEHL